MLHPDNPTAGALFSLLGHVRVLPNAARFNPASAIAAFYGWVCALLETTVAWTVRSGMPAQTARSLALEAVRGAVNMALSQPDDDLVAMLDTLATPGGITERGLDLLRQQHGVSAWTVALVAVLNQIQVDERHGLNSPATRRSASFGEIKSASCPGMLEPTAGS